MHYYIVDPQKISQREFERVQNLLYSSLSQYRVSGEVVRATGLRTINQLVENAFAHGARTIVAVGSDDTLHDIINAVRDRDIIVGFIPIFDTEIGEILGIKTIANAAKIIGSRRIEELDLVSVNNPPAAQVSERAGNYFLSKLTFGLSTYQGSGALGLFNFKLLQSLFNLPVFEIKFSVDGQYQATVSAVAGLIINSRGGECTASSSDPTDGVVDIMLLPKLSRIKILKYYKHILSGCFEQIPEASVIHANKLEISLPASLPLRSGSRIIAKTPAVIEVRPKALKIIVGKDRKF